MSNVEEFTKRYDALLKHYGLEGRKIQTGKEMEMWSSVTIDLRGRLTNHCC
ncbi:MAG: hypothetical protein HQK96_05255 [Nitrospirae bacterium]|nr:hypothetical protein [Nitrospirota bacterium]